MDFPAACGLFERAAFQPIKVTLLFIADIRKEVPHCERVIPEDFDPLEVESVTSGESLWLVLPDARFCVFQIPILSVFQKIKARRGGMFQGLELVL